MGAQADNEDPSRGGRLGGNAGDCADGGDAGEPQLRLVIQHPFTFTQEVAELETELQRISEATNTECSFVASRECVRVLGYARDDLDQARVEVTSLLRLLGKDNFRTRALKLPEKKLAKKPKAANPKEVQPKLPGDSDEEDTKWSEEPQPREMSVFCLDRRIRNLSAIVNNYGPEHLPPVVPGAVDKLRDLRAETGVEIETDLNDPRLVTVSGPHFATVQDVVRRLECLQKSYLDPPPSDVEPQIVVHHNDQTVTVRVGLQRIVESRKRPFRQPLPRALSNVFDIVVTTGNEKRVGYRDAVAADGARANTSPKSYSSVAREIGKVVSPGAQRFNHGIGVAAQSLRNGLEYARLWRGEVRLEAKVGIVVVSRATDRHLRQTVSFDKLQSVFEGKKAKLHFGDIATASRKVTEQLILTLSKPLDPVQPPTPQTGKSPVPGGPGYAAVLCGDTQPPPVVPAETVPAGPPAPRIRTRREVRFVITCKGRADIIHPWTYAKITLDAGTLKPLSIVPLASTAMSDVYWKHLDNRWDWRLRLKGWHREGRFDVKPFITFLRKLTLSPQGGGLSYEDQPELFEVLRLKHKLTVFIPLDDGSKNECAITRVVVLRLPREGAEEDHEVEGENGNGGGEGDLDTVNGMDPPGGKDQQTIQVRSNDDQDSTDELGNPLPSESSEADADVDPDGIPRQHYTIKVQSKRWQELFSENRTMGLGKVASWTVDDVLGRPATGSVSSALNQLLGQSSGGTASTWASSSSSSSTSSLDSSFAKLSFSGSAQNLGTAPSPWDVSAPAEANPLFNKLLMTRPNTGIASPLATPELTGFVGSVTKLVNLMNSVCGSVGEDNVDYAAPPPPQPARRPVVRIVDS